MSWRPVNPQCSWLLILIPVFMFPLLLLLMSTSHIMIRVDMSMLNKFPTSFCQKTFLPIYGWVILDLFITRITACIHSPFSRMWDLTLVKDRCIWLKGWVSIIIRAMEVWLQVFYTLFSRAREMA